MKSLLVHLSYFFLRLGPSGLLLLGVLDSSFLFMPLGNDLLVVALTARKPDLLPLYAALAAVGSVSGCLIVDLVCRKGGEAGLEHYIAGKRLEYVRRRVKKSAAWALVLAAVMPPPFPFTIFVIAASALRYPRKRLLSVIGASRFARFLLIGLLAVFFGPGILRLGQKPEVQYAIIGLIVISLAGSGLSVYRWIRQSRRATVR